jgi:enolase-phosphatase E1
LPETLRSKWDEPEFAQYRDAFPPEHSTSPAALADHARDLMSRDVKIAYLKSLQGYLWENGYATGEIKAPLFPDVAPKLASWHGEGKPIMIYSSGSVPAQKLLFRYTNGDPSDLIPLLTDFFDTVNAGPKMEASSYEKIQAKHPEYPFDEWLFLSDNVKEVEAAKQAGMQSYIVERAGNAELSPEARTQHRVITSLDEI